MYIVVLGVVGLLALGVLVLIINKLLFICGPNEVLIFSGGRRRVGGGVAGYRAIKGGRKLKIPLLEVVDRMDLSNMSINVSVKGAFSKGGIPLNVDGVANVKVAGQEPVLSNAVERLLGKPRHEIIQIAKETLEGNLRGVLATLTPEQVNSDKITFARQLMEEADQDLQRLGMELDTMKIQNVSDERGYLDALGRKSGAKIRMQATIAEAETQASSAIKEAENLREAESVRIDAAIRTLEATTDREVTDARTRQAALVAASRGEIQALIAETKAQVEVQRARIEQVRQKLEADVIAPAEAEMQAAINRARGEAAKIVEDGRATADALTQVTQAWKQAGEHARDLFLMQKLDSLVETLASTIEGIRVDKITVLGTPETGNGTEPAAKLIGISEQLKAALGVDLLGALQGRLAPKESGESA
jgi:flotillin